MIKYSDSNVFNTGTDAIVNTINCVGFMGKGLALEYALRYPKLLEEYKQKCNKKEIIIGKIYYFQSDKLIINFPTKNDYKFPSKLEWIELGLQDFIKTYKKYNIKSVSFPLLGCGNGGLNPDIVKKMMEKYLSNLDIEVVICLDKNNPEGKELEMINSFNRLDVEILSKYVSLNNKQKETIKLNQGKIDRFYEISKLEGIGFITYKNIFRLLYDNNINLNKSEYYQQSLF